jgi:cytochrome c oxidase assembly protein subunit 16
MAFQSKTHKQSRAGMLYRSAVAKHPFILFGLPFLAVIVSGSFFLTPATALRYEKHDQKRKWMSKEEALSSMEGLQRRKVNPRDEYYVSMGVNVAYGTQLTPCRDWRLRISMIGSREESSDCQENRMAYWNELAMSNTCMDWRLGHLTHKSITIILRGELLNTMAVSNYSTLSNIQREYLRFQLTRLLLLWIWCFLVLLNIEPPEQHDGLLSIEPSKNWVRRINALAAITRYQSWVSMGRKRLNILSVNG